MPLPFELKEFNSLMDNNMVDDGMDIYREFCAYLDDLDVDTLLNNINVELLPLDQEQSNTGRKHEHNPSLFFTDDLLNFLLVDIIDLINDSNDYDYDIIYLTNDSNDYDSDTIDLRNDPNDFDHDIIDLTNDPNDFDHDIIDLTNDSKDDGTLEEHPFMAFLIGYA